MTKLTRNKILRLKFGCKMKVRLTKPSSSVVVYEGEATLTTQYRPNGDMCYIAPNGYNWIVYNERNINSDGNCLMDDYLMEIFEDEK